MLVKMRAAAPAKFMKSVSTDSSPVLPWRRLAMSCQPRERMKSTVVDCMTMGSHAAGAV